MRFLRTNLSKLSLAIGAASGEGLVSVDLARAVVVAKLVPSGSSFRVTGLLAGRWESKKLLTSLQMLHDPFGYDASLCGSDPGYGDGKGAPCNALSVAFAFQAEPATYGSVFAPDAAGGGCGPQWTDQCGP